MVALRRAAMITPAAATRLTADSLPTYASAMTSM